jgi:hypothetical protein
MVGPLAVAAYVTVYLRTIPSDVARMRHAWLLGLAGVVGYADGSELVLAGLLARVRGRAPRGVKRECPASRAKPRGGVA